MKRCLYRILCPPDDGHNAQPKHVGAQKSKLYAAVGVKTTVCTAAWNMYNVLYAKLYINQPDHTVCVCVIL